MAQQSIPSTSIAPPVTAAKPASRRWVVFAGVGVVLAVLGIAYWLHARQFEDTDDAQIDGNISNVSPRVTGTILAVHVVENQVGQAGRRPRRDRPDGPADRRRPGEGRRSRRPQAQLEAEDPIGPHHGGVERERRWRRRSPTSPARRRRSSRRAKDVAQLTAQLAQAEANDRTAQLEQGALREAHRARRDRAVRLRPAHERGGGVVGERRRAPSSRWPRRGTAWRSSRRRSRRSQSHLAEVQSNAPRQVATRKASVELCGRRRSSSRRRSSRRPR